MGYLFGENAVQYANPRGSPHLFTGLLATCTGVLLRTYVIGLRPAAKDGVLGEYASGRLHVALD